MAYKIPRKTAPLVLGEEKAFLDHEMAADQRSQHTHVIGATQTGKSRFLLSLIQQDIRAGRGLCLIDPHGELVDHVYDWLAKNEHLASRRKIRVLDLNDQTWSFGFNPLAVTDDRQISATIDQAVNGMASVMGGEDLTQTPLLRMTLYAICSALAYARLSLNEAQYLVNPFHPTEREAITATVENTTWKRVWDNFNLMAAGQPKMYLEYFQAAERRFIPFISDESVRAILGQTEQTIDLKQAMDEGEILLVDVSRVGGFVPAESAQIVARLLINNLVAKAYTRDPKTCRPFNLYVDEVQNFLSGDVPEILSQCRKYGLHLTLAHQYLGQLKDAGDLIYDGIMGTARNKVVFGVDNPDDAEILARRIFAGMTQYEMPKRSMIKPTVVGHEIIRLQSASQNRNRSKSQAEATAVAESEMETSSQAFSTSESQSQSHSESVADSVTHSTSQSQSDSSSRSSGSTSGHGSTSNHGAANSMSAGHAAGEAASMGQSMGMSSDADGNALSQSDGRTGGSALSHTASAGMGQSISSGFGSTSSAGMSEGSSSGETSGTSSGTSIGTTRAVSDTTSFGTSTGTTEGFSTGIGRTVSKGLSTGISEGTGESEGYAEALRPIFEALPTALYSLEEQRNMFMDQVLTLPNRRAFVVMPGGGMAKITSLDVPDIRVSQMKKARIIGELKSSSSIHRDRAKIMIEIEGRMAAFLEARSLGHVIEDDPMNPRPSDPMNPDG